MKNQALFDTTIKILVNAYLNNTLVAGNCHACAVGNMMAARLNLKYTPQLKWREQQPAWPEVFVTLGSRIAQVRRPWAYTGAAKVQIDATGYTWPELARLEYAFERAPRSNSPEAYLFSRLMAVVEVLSQIHEINEVTQAAAKELFVKG